jgi:Ca-activated chloride channel family protein
MGRRPPRPAALRGGWLALGLSVAAHGLVLALLWLLPGDAPEAAGPLPISTVVLLSDDEAAPPAPAASAEPEPAPEREILSPVTLPAEPVAVDPGAASAEPPPPAAEPGAGPAPAAPGAGGSAAGGRTGPTFFGGTAEGGSVVYVIDRSASMGLGDGLSAAKRELLASLRQLPASARFQVIFYSREAEALGVDGRTDLLPATAENVDAAARFLERLRAGGSTDHLPALRKALALQPDVIFLVTDAADLSPEQVRAVTQWNGGRTAIHAIDLGGRAGGSPLEALALGNRGTYRAVNPAGAE